jgi:hypothetical protein
MEFPAFRVATKEASIAHELAHVFFPNGNRMLAEGLAVYVQTVIGMNPSFPNFGYDLDDIVAAFLKAKYNSDPSAIRLESLDKIATPDNLRLRIGLDRLFDSPDTYPVAGSFVRFLILKFGMEKFRAFLRDKRARARSYARRRSSFQQIK